MNDYRETNEMFERVAVSNAVRQEYNAMVWYTRLLTGVTTVGLLLFLVLSVAIVWMISSFNVMPADVLKEVRSVHEDINELRSDLQRFEGQVE